MDIGIRAGRDQLAQERIVKAAATLADRYGMPALVLPRARDTAVEAMLQREVIAGLLEALLDVTQAVPASVIEQHEVKATKPRK